MEKNKKRKDILILKIFSGILIIAGLIIYLLPVISNWLYNEDIKEIKHEYFKKVNDDDNKSNKYQDLYNELKKQNEYLYINKQENLTDPFSYEQPTIFLDEYGIQDNIIGFISIPKINIDIPIYLGANTENMKKGAVHLTETSYPIGGENTNSVIAAHRGYSKSAMFRNIDKLNIGDEVYIHNFMETLQYKVCEIKIIKPTDVKELLIQDGRDLVTLITCHPYRVNSHRYIVYCERIS